MAEQKSSKKFDVAIKETLANIDAYFNSLNQIELIAWSLIGLGVILVVLGLIFL